MNNKEDISCIYDRVSQRIRFFRRYRGLTQEELAEKTTFSRGLIGNIESLKTSQTFSLAVLYAFARALDVPLELFVKEDIENDLFQQGFIDTHGFYVDVDSLPVTPVQEGSKHTYMRKYDFRTKTKIARPKLKKKTTGSYKKKTKKAKKLKSKVKKLKK